MHCFSGDAGFARRCLDRGFWLSFPGTVTFKANEPLREALDLTPSDRVLVETDAPYLTPMPLRGKPNAPYLLPHTVRFLAERRGVDVAELCGQLAANATALFGDWGTPDDPVPATPEPGRAIPEPVEGSPRGNTHGRRPARTRVPSANWPPNSTCDRPKQRGQNFVHDANTVRRIVSAAGVGAGDVVLEIGPGLGSLTLGLLEAGCQVVAVEIERSLAARLPRTVAERLPEHAGALADDRGRRARRRHPCRPAAHRGGGEPAVQRQRPRPAARAGVLPQRARWIGDGAVRGGRPAGRRARPRRSTECPRPSWPGTPRPAGSGRCRRRCSGRCPTWIRAWWPSRAGSRPAPPPAASRSSW